MYVLQWVRVSGDRGLDLTCKDSYLKLFMTTSDLQSENREGSFLALPFLFLSYSFRFVLFFFLLHNAAIFLNQGKGQK